MSEEIVPKEARQEALQRYISGFAERLKIDHPKMNVIVDAAASAEAITDLYFRYAEEIIRPTIDSGIIQHYKIIGYTELCILRVSPIELNGHASPMSLVTVNAQLALNIAVNMLIDWNMLDPDKFSRLIMNDNEIRSFLREHILWLSHLDSRYYFPGFANAQVWKLFHYLVSDRINKLTE